MRLPSTCAALLVAAAWWPASAWAATPAEAQAEVQRLRGEMVARSARNAWDGVERAYVEALALSKDPAAGVVLTYNDHMLGAMAARSIGDVAATRDRLQRAMEVEPTDDARGWLREIAGSYATVRIISDPEFSGQMHFAIAVPPIPPDQRAAVERAEHLLSRDRTFVGLLPEGDYTLRDTTFEVLPGGAELEVTVAKGGDVRVGRAGEQRLVDRLTPRVRLGVGYTQATAATQGVQPEPFGGPGGRAALGLGVAIGASWAIEVEGGYHGLVGLDAVPVASGDELRAATHLAYGQLALARTSDRAAAFVGPVAGIGVARAAGLDGDAWSSFCASNPADGRCASEAGATGAQLSSTALTGSLSVIGAAAGARLTLFTPGQLTGGLAMSVGALGDGARLYPFADLGLVVER